MKKSHEKILEVMREAGRPLCEHEFETVTIHKAHEGGANSFNGRAYIGESSSAIGRRLREMRVIGLVSSKKREGKQFKEYSPVAVVSDKTLVGAGA